MAELRREYGVINESILTLLEREGRPLSGHAIVRQLALAGNYIAPSQIFRALKRLLAERLVQRIELVNGYAVGRPDETLSLVCRECGVVQRVSAPVLFDQLEALARGVGTAPDRLVIESTGRCARCRAAANGRAPAGAIPAS